MDLKIAVLAGDGIGPEIMKQGVAVMDAIAAKFGHNFIYKEAISGAHAIDEVGDPFPEETFQRSRRARQAENRDQAAGQSKADGSSSD